MVRISVELPDAELAALENIATARDTTVEALLVDFISLRVACYIRQSVIEPQASDGPGLGGPAFDTRPPLQV